MVSAWCGVSDSTAPWKFNMRLNWQFNLEFELSIGDMLTIWQSAGPTFNLYGAGTNLDVGIDGLPLKEQFTYHGGIRYYFDKEKFSRYPTHGFRGRYFTIQYGVSFDHLVKRSYYEKTFAQERNYVSFLIGYLGKVFDRIYYNVALGLAIDTTSTFYGPGPLGTVNFGYRLWQSRPDS